MQRRLSGEEQPVQFLPYSLTRPGLKNLQFEFLDVRQLPGMRRGNKRDRLSSDHRPAIAH